jgi:transposase
MCSWTAKRKNQQCAELYERLSKKGKPEKVIKVAIAHKLVRQIFGVIKLIIN